jgi:hypothetical protein
MRDQHVAADTVVPATLRGTVLAAVEFHDQTQLEAGKVRKVGADGMLPPKTQAAQTSRSQSIPQTRFRERLVFSQAPRKTSLIVAKLHATSMR